MYANREAMTASPARNASGAAASSLRRELLLNMDHLQRLYAEEKEARKEAEQELLEALQLVKQAQIMATNGRKEAAALRRRLVSTEQTARAVEASLRRQLAEVEANSARNRIPDSPRSAQHHNAAQDELVASDAAFVRKPLDGWEAVHHAPSGRWCYFNPATGVVSWDLDGVAANNERRSRPTSPQLPTSPQQSREEGSSARVPRQPGTPTKHQTAVVSKVGAASTARAAAEAYPHGRKPEPEPEPQPQAEVDVRKEHVGSGLPLPPDLSAAPIPSNNPGPAAPPSAIALHTKHEAEVGVKPESTDDRTPPVSVGDCCVLLRSALLRSEPSLSSPEVERLAAESRIRVLEVARCWRFPLPGHPVWRMRVGLVDESVPNENGSVADGTEVLPVSLGWISMKTKAGDDMVRNEATKQVPDEQGVGAAAAVRPAQEQQLTPQLTSIAQPGRPTHPALQTSATNIAKRGALLTPSDRAQQKVAARMERIDRLAEQKEAEYEWQQVAHQSGKSYWYQPATGSVSWTPPLAALRRRTGN